MTYRQNYREDPQQQYRGYPDSDTNRAWGVAEWASRVGQGALLDWIVGNAMLPPGDGLPAPPGEQKVDRSTVLELREIASAFATVQQHGDNMDIGLNPLGVAKNAIPFGLELATGGGFKDGKNHFEQVYDRAVMALNDAIGVFNHANEASQMLRRQFDTELDFKRGVEKQELDFTNRLIEVFGRPYDADVGPGKTYPSGYTGSDTEDFHFLFGDPSVAVGVTPQSPLVFTITNRVSTLDTNGNLLWSEHPVTFYLSQEGFGLIKPPSWGVSTRPAVGEIQNRQTEVFQAKSRYDKAFLDYNNHLAQIEDQAALLHAQFNLNDLEIIIMYQGLNMQETLNTAVRRSRERQLDFQTKGRMATLNANAIAEGLPALTGLIAGTSSGFMADLWGVARFGILQDGNQRAEDETRNANQESLAELDIQQAKEIQQTVQNIILTTNRQAQAAAQQIAQLQELVRLEASIRLDLYTTLESINQAAASYRSAIAHGQRLIEERQRPPRAEPAAGEPGIVIEFPSVMYADKNFFGLPGTGGETSYNPTFFAAKITSMGLWFSGYLATAQGLDQAPYAYLIPAGMDQTRVPNALDFRVREWRVVDQKIPMPRDFLADPSLVTSIGIPIYDGLTGTFAEINKFSAVDGTVDLGSGTLDTSKITRDSRLLGRSVWNSRWMLIIPGIELHRSDPQLGIQRFINGNGSWKGVSDIKLYFETYHYSGN